ncbi:MAG: hypothetical protein D6705_02035 [Deltaproteobacteria bacterium]|nr:MAG: hypothetical protein D6705_02035 [Deltaproteobacteria bacterium]
MDAPPAGIVFSHPEQLARARGLDGLSWVFARNFLLDLPRAAAARRLAERVAKVAPSATFVPYVWHLVSHGADDPLSGRGSRRPAGAPENFGGLRDTPEVSTALSAQLESTRAAGADAWCLTTPPSISPGAAGRARLARFFEYSRNLGLTVFWQPEGVWTPDEAAACLPPGDRLLWPVGPLEGHADLPPGALALVRPRRPRLRPAEIDAIVERSGPGVVFGGPHAVSAAAAYLRATRDA